MNVKKHVTILYVIGLIEIILAIVLFVLMTQTNSIEELYCIPFILLAAIWAILLYAAPVRCDKTGCQGRMKTNWVKDSVGSERLQYVCPECGEIFETGFSVGLGTPW